ncbi:MAG TPA: phosphatase PAP2 family protein [Oscillospiraceae bacterium]|nr:phosphatase PAP2 family protein [Oscillospiraceae bacterium]HNW04200.1 phosphatase PAP2 family protein [Oscillospiraceae bacterium]
MKQRSQTWREWLRGNPHAWYALLFPLYMLSYFITEALVGENADYWVSYLPLDDKIPFLEWFVPIYYFWALCLLTVGLYLLVKDGAGFKKFMISLFGGMGASLLICLLFPNGQNLRPEVFPRENLFTEMVRIIYSLDTCTNVFPSMHVVGAVAGVGAVFHSAALRRFRLPAVALCALICASTVCLKQHSILDVYGGVALGAALWWIVYRKKKTAPHEAEIREQNA